ncbi:hypothetical protein EPI10_005576 [Gossypium australe]|uniref:Uncharacterized protein n=1 Tax=Gossypium australe TaxID=47621 RepID=A0A5B6WPY4_9ROSI|nr:hypothetical protein EPI10_005576 [Gossypium australe]
MIEKVYTRDVHFLWRQSYDLVVSNSTLEADYRSLAHAIAEILQVTFDDKAQLWCDNLRAAVISVNPVLHSKFKHVTSSMLEVGHLPTH